MKRLSVMALVAMLVGLPFPVTAYAADNPIDLRLTPNSIHFENALPGVPQSQVVTLVNAGSLDAQISPVFSGLDEDADQIDLDFAACEGSWSSVNRAPTCRGLLQTGDIVAKAPSKMELLVTVTLDKNLTTSVTQMAWSGKVVFEGVEVIPIDPEDKDEPNSPTAAPIFIPLDTQDDLPPTGINLEAIILTALSLVLFGLLLWRTSERTSDE